LTIEKVSGLASTPETPEPTPATGLESRILRSAKGSGILFASAMITYALRFVIGFVLARFLGSEQLGLHQLALTVATFVGGATSLGLDSALIRHIPRFAAKRDEAGLWGVLQVGLGLPLAVSLLAGAGVLILAEPIATLVLHDPSLVPLLRMLSFAIPFMTLTTVASAATRGFNLSLIHI